MSGAERSLFIVLALMVGVLIISVGAALLVGESAKWPIALAGLFCAAVLDNCLIRLGRAPHQSVVISLPVLVLPALAPAFSPIPAAGIIAIGILVVELILLRRPVLATYRAAVAGLGALVVAVTAAGLELAGVLSHTALALSCGAYVVFFIVAERLRVRVIGDSRNGPRRAISWGRVVVITAATIAIARVAGPWSESGLPLMSQSNPELNTLIVLLLIVVVAATIAGASRHAAMKRRLVRLIEATLALSLSEASVQTGPGIRGRIAQSDDDAAAGISELLCRSVADTIGAGSVTVRPTPPLRGEIGAPLIFSHSRSEFVVARRDAMDISFSDEDQNALEALAYSASAVMIARLNIGGLTMRANSDPLTGLPNYGAFKEALTNINDHRVYAEALAVLFIDLDDFKRLNDRHGHAVGDEMLREIGRRLEASVRPFDIVARVGGDEFVVILTQLTSLAEAKSVAEQVKESTAEPVVIDGNTFSLVLSIGLAYSAHRETDIDALVHDADRSMLITKRARRGIGSDKTSSINVSSHRSSHLNDIVVRAIDEDRLDLAFQPIVSLISNQIWAFEALVRYTDDEIGPVPASSLVEKAKALGRLDALTCQVAQKALAAAAAFRLVEPRVVCIAINVEAAQLMPDRVGRFLIDLADRYPEISLCLELNERSVARLPAGVRDQAERMRDLGIMIALDDYGSQDSSVDALVRLPMDILKIDRGLVDDLADVRQRAVLTALQSFGDTLEYSMIVEGVEDQRMADHLNAIGVRSAQGFHYGVPQSQEQILDRLEKFGAAAILPRVDVVADPESEFSLVEEPLATQAGSGAS